MSKPAAETPSAPRRCPICRRPAVAAVRPFCSRRCADIDLHRWLSGVYATPAVEAEGDEDLSGYPPADPTGRGS